MNNNEMVELIKLSKKKAREGKIKHIHLKCELCGSRVKVTGKTTKSYENLDEIRLDKAIKMLTIYADMESDDSQVRKLLKELE